MDYNELIRDILKLSGNLESVGDIWGARVCCKAADILDALEKVMFAEESCEYCDEDSCELCIHCGSFIDCEWKPAAGEMCEEYERANYCRRCGRKLPVNLK